MNLSKRLILLILLLALLLLGDWLLNSQVKTALLARFLPQSVSTISVRKEEMVTNNLLKLARAIAEFEGWNYRDENGVGLNHASASWCNHNPGNLKKSPFAIAKNDDFAIFIDDETGFYALVWDIWQKAHGNTVTELTDESSIYELIKVYSGESDDEADRYARFVEQRTGLPTSTKLRELVEN